MIVPYTKINKSGEKISYWTHSSFLDEQQLEKIKKSEAIGRTIRNYLALAGALVGLKASSVPQISKHIPKTVPVIGVAGISALLFFGVGHLLFVKGKAEKQMANLLQINTIPLWKQKSRVANLGRLFIHLDDTKNNKVDILHHGLTPENAARLFPDEISGPTPKAPEADHLHSHDQGHGHSHKQGKEHH